MADTEPSKALFVDDYLDMNTIDVFDTYPSKYYFYFNLFTKNTI